MPLEVARTRKLLADFDFKQLFIEELGWNRHDARLQIPVDSQSFSLTAVAEKCGMAAFLCGPGAGGPIPEYQVRRKIERQVARTAHEHLIVFVDANQTAQIWQWVRREQGRPAACREHTYHKGQPGDSLIQKLQALAVSLDEEESLTLPDVTGRARRAFDVDRVTKKFYDRFKREHDTFLEFLEGIPDEDLERWYVSVMLNRLMFIYFVQKKGFLDNDPDYLKNKLAQCRNELGKDHYYLDFLCPLFFEGFAKQKQDRSEQARRLFGEVPYLNGGIFMPHQIEQLHGQAIKIPDKAFEKLFEFFDAYHWHLDERPLRQDNEINPDVLGYIFEKYINQKQMGAYYTKEDITEYISKNTVVPYLFDATREKCKVAFEGDRSTWRLLQEDPDRYIHSAVRHGAGLSLPAEIADGLDTSKPNLIERRKVWNRSASAEYALPTEIWREVVARRKRYEEVRDKLASGEVCSINDLITYNLDIRQFAQDVIENAEGPELLVAFWKAIEAVTVLDPACGSGAFLFAALNILEPLYEACLERMRFFLEEWGENGRKNHPNYHKLFTETLKRVEDHPNYRYFILKSIIVSNLYGVDIMEEAIEICKLRLFLKLVAQIEHVTDLEPLPDIDFNIRAGNTLVGFVSLDEVKKTQEGTLGLGKDEIARIEEEAEIADRAFCQFRHMQTEQGMSPKDFAAAKETLRKRLGKLTDELDRFLAGEYGISRDKFRKDKMAEYEAAFSEWRKNHQPFHWFADFYGILKTGGFDVIMGNPPYVEYARVKDEYTIRGYTTETCGNLYAYMIERCFSIRSTHSLLGQIVPLSIMATERMSSLQRLFLGPRDKVWLSAFDVYPSKLFEGAKQRLTIVVHSALCNTQGVVWATRYNRWRPEERGHLFATLHYGETQQDSSLGVIPKLGDASFKDIVDRLKEKKPEQFRSGKSTPSFYVHRIPYNYVKAINFIPYFWNETDGLKKSEDYKPYSLNTPSDSKIALAVFNANLFFFWWYTLYEGYHCGRHEIESFPIGLGEMSDSIRRSLADLADMLMEDLKSKARRKECNYRNTGRVVYDEFYPRFSKPIIDQIDTVLADHYGLSDEQLDFLLNFDSKYRDTEDNAKGLDNDV